MIITKVNGNDVREVEVDTPYEDVIKTLFIIPACEKWFNQNKPEGITLENVVDYAYDYFDDCEFDGFDEHITDMLNDRGMKEIESDD